MKTQQEIETFLAAQMHGTWNHLDHLSRTACCLAYAIGDRHGYEEGYEAGFQVGSAAERGICELQKKFNEVDQRTAEPAPTPTDLADTSNGAGAVHPIFDPILRGIKP